MKSRNKYFERFIVTCFFMFSIAWIAFIVYVVKSAN